MVEKIESGPHGSLHEAILLSLQKGYPGYHVYFKHMAALVGGLGLEGKVILVGRGAHYLLPAEAGVRVRCVGDWERRVEQTQRRLQCSWQEARDRLKRMDDGRVEMIWKLFRRDLNDPSSYDLILNLSTLDTKAAADAVSAVLESKVQVEAAA